jgi:hypothetical protein
MNKNSNRQNNSKKRSYVNPAEKKRAISDLEREKGRSENYWQKSAEDQWAEDKRLGILDWDGS